MDGKSCGVPTDGDTDGAARYAHCEPSSLSPGTLKSSSGGRGTEPAHLGAPLGKVVQGCAAVRPTSAHHNCIKHFAGQACGQKWQCAAAEWSGAQRWTSGGIKLAAVAAVAAAGGDGGAQASRSAIVMFTCHRNYS